MKQLLGAMLVSALCVCSCHAGDSGASPRAPGSDAKLPLILTDIPAGCPPTKGNEKGVGDHCTRNGRDCKNGMTCLCDDRVGFAMPDNMPCFCTNPAVGTCGFTNPNCGTNAMCCEFPLSGTTMISGCFPSVCLPQDKCPVFIPADTDAGPDARSDARSDAAATR